MDLMDVLWSHVLFYSAHASSLRLRSAGAHFVRRAVALASALACFGGVHHYSCSKYESGLVYIAHASSLRLRSAGAHFVRRAVPLASALACFGGAHHQRHPRENGDPMPASALYAAKYGFLGFT